MPAEIKTPNIGLNQWQGNEYVKREDFVQDNLIIDTEIKNIQDGLNNKVSKAEGKGLSTEDYTTAEKNKLAGIEDGATKYEHPSTHPAGMITEEVNKRFMTDAERTKLAGIAAGANNYTHPATHPASIITESATKRFVSDTEKANWNGKLGASAQATDSAKLGGQLPSYYAKAADLNKTNGAISFKTGTVSGGGTIPQTSGYANYVYLVSPREMLHTNETFRGFNCYVNSNRTVVANYYYGTSSSPIVVQGTANYIEIAWN